MLLRKLLRLDRLTWTLVLAALLAGAVPPVQASSLPAPSQPGSVELEYFIGTAVYPSHILLEWQSVSEQQTTAFRLKRGTTPNPAQATIITNPVIPAHPGSPSGYLYSYLDSAGLVPGVIYYDLMLPTTAADTNRTAHGGVPGGGRWDRWGGPDAGWASLVNGLLAAAGIGLTYAVARSLLAPPLVPGAGRRGLEDDLLATPPAAALLPGSWQNDAQNPSRDAVEARQNLPDWWQALQRDYVDQTPSGVRNWRVLLPTTTRAQ